MKACRRVEVELLTVLTSALDRDELSASWPGRFTARGRLVDPLSGLGALEIRQNILPMP
jgi:hypothetical protein